MPGPDPTPVAGAEAYTRRDRDARLSQAAIVLSLGAAAAGQPERVDRPDAVGLPTDLAPLGQPEPVPLEEAVAPLGITADEQRSRSGPAVPSDTRAALMDQVVADPNPTNAAALVEACLHSGDRLVRTAAAVSALDTTGPRDDVVAQLVDGATRGRDMAKDIGRIGLARVDPAPPGAAARRRPHDAARRQRPALAHRVHHPRHVRGADHVVAARRGLLHLPRRAHPTPARPRPELPVERPVLRRRPQAGRAADARLGREPGPAATGPVRPQPRRHGGEPGDRARPGARPARPAELARPRGVVPRLHPGSGGSSTSGSTWTW